MRQVRFGWARRVAAGFLSVVAAGFSPFAFPASVHLVLDINQIPSSGSAVTADSDPADFVDFDGRLIFTADDGVHGRELWQSDGTAAGTQMISDLVPGASGSNPNNLFVGNGSLYFFALNSQGVSHLMRLPSGSGATPIELTPLAGHACTQSAVLNGKVLFLASSNGTPYSQLWTSDGTPAGTTRVDDPSSAWALSPCYLSVIGNALYFSGRRPQDGGSAIWRSDGTWAGSSLFVPSTYGSGAIYGLNNGTIYFNADTVNRFGGIYRADGTPTGTQQLLAAQEPFGNGPYATIGLIGITNGRPIGLHTFVNPLTIPVTVELRLYFVDDPVGGGSTVPNAQFRQGDPTLVTSSHTFFVGVDSSGREPWVTDGTSGGTHIIRDFVPGGDPTVHWFAKYHDTYLIRLVDPNVGSQLWQSDTTSAGTSLIADVVAEPPIKSGAGGISYRPEHGTGGADFYFVGRNDQLGNELYVLADDAPIAVPDTGASADGRAIRLSVLANDSDPDGSLDASSVRIVAAPTRGTASVGADGVVTYTPDAGYSGSDSFSYTVADNLGKPSAATTVTLTITAAPQAPAPRASSGGGATRGVDLFVLLLMLVAVGPSRKNAALSLFRDPPAASMGLRDSHATQR